MTIEITAFRWVPPFAQGYVKDLRVRWALNEAGFDYAVTLIGPDEQGSAAYRAWQPFGQVPAYRDDDVELFESGAILLHLAGKSEVLAPAGPAGQARASVWVFATLNSIEPVAHAFIDFEDEGLDADWAAAHRARLEARLSGRLAALADQLGGRDYLEDRFTVGDLAMTTVLRELVDSGVLAKFPTLDAHRRRCEGRPAFGRALEAQLQAFRENAPAPVP